MYNKLPIALGAALAVGVAGFAGGAMAKVEEDTTVSYTHLRAHET